MRLNRNLTDTKSRKLEIDEEVTKTVQEILRELRRNGDAALRCYAKKIDGFADEELLASKEELKIATQRVGEEFMRILHRARKQITKFHVNQIDRSWATYKDNGVMMGQIVRPLKRVALYVPGGTAAYPSTVLMNAIPATLAGVEEIAIFTPVKSDGKIADVVLAAAACCGIERIYKVGGAQAIGAAAYGTESIARFDKIVGPGNSYVTTAKRLVYGKVDIDILAGPSEVLIIADETANPKYIAADLMSQAEHDELARAILITTSLKVIKETEKEIDRQIENLERREIIEVSLQNYGAAILAKELKAAFEIANEIAPEHLEILTENPIEKLPLIQNAGSIFLGESTPEPLGDYMSGTNHVLPTGGTAKFYSPLGVYDFIKYSNYSYYSREALTMFKDDVATFAAAEGLDAHGNAIKVRFEE